ncbi:MAG TPA: Maf family protein, partial [Oleiagrimonas sp.]|nr:Maf family protein [Oleiagrimonas sp.]
MLYLASQSPRRRQLLEQIGIDFRVLKVDVPEQRQPGETPLGYVERVARDKARAALAHLGDEP